MTPPGNVHTSIEQMRRNANSLRIMQQDHVTRSHIFDQLLSRSSRHRVVKLCIRWPVIYLDTPMQTMVNTFSELEEPWWRISNQPIGRQTKRLMMRDLRPQQLGHSATSRCTVNVPDLSWAKLLTQLRR